MPSRRRAVVVDGRIIFREQCRGIARSVIGLVEHFPSCAGDGAVKVLVARRGSTPFDLGGMAERAELVETDLPVVALHRVVETRRLLGSLDAGVLFSPYHPFTPLTAPCPVVSAVHDCILEEDPAFAGGRLRQLGYMGLSKLSLGRTASVTVPSHATAHAVLRYYPEVTGTEVVPNGVALRVAGEGTAAGIEATREALRLPDRYLLHVGARRPHKNQRLLVELLARLDPSISLVLVGKRDPRMGDDLEGQVRELRLEDRVVVLDDVDDDYLPALYAGAAAFVFPSLVEGYGIPPLEAMAAGTPVVASAIPVLAEVCRDAAKFVSPFDLDGWESAVRCLLDDPHATQVMADRGEAVARQATWERGGLALYDTLVRVRDLHRS